jgi:hypothetical protein
MAIVTPITPNTSVIVISGGQMLIVKVSNAGKAVGFKEYHRQTAQQKKQSSCDFLMAEGHKDEGKLIF